MVVTLVADELEVDFWASWVAVAVALGVAAACIELCIGSNDVDAMFSKAEYSK
jgi:hypothetical protein